MAVQIQLRRDTAANWTTNDPTLAAGEFAIETDTDKYKIGDGSTAWTSLAYSSLPSTSISNALVDAVGDIIHASADNTVAKLAVGTNDHVLTADSTVSGVGIKWAAPAAAAAGSLTGATMASGVTASSLTSVGTLTGLTVSGAINAADQIVQKPVLKDIGETTVANATSGSTDTIDLEDGNVHNVTLTANCTFTFSNPPASGTSGTFTLFLNQDGTGSRTATWPSEVKWAGGTAPTLTTTASRTDILVFTTIDAGTIWYGAVSGQDFS